MALPTISLLADVLTQVQSSAAAAKAQAQSAVSRLASANVDSVWVMAFLDQIRRVISEIDRANTVAGLADYAAANIPGYTGNLTTDLSVTRQAAVSCLNWVVTNFPKDSASGYYLVLTINADGSRTSREFTPAQTAGLRTALTSFINTIE